MGNRRQVIKNLLLGGAVSMVASPLKLLGETSYIKANPSTIFNNEDDRAYWVKLFYRMANPVIDNLANNTLKKNMATEMGHGYTAKTIDVTYLEAISRTLAGIAPWLSLPDDGTAEGKMRKVLRDKSLQGIVNSVDPSSPDYINFKTDNQPIVDAAYMAQSFMRAPKALWEPLDNKTKQRIVTEFKSLRNREPHQSNWLCFGAATEAFLLSIGEGYVKHRLVDAIDTLQSWYVGDGWYSDGPLFALDYYNSYVMHPFIVDTLWIMEQNGLAKKEAYDLAFKRMVRYAEQQEKMISPEGTFPPIGRSITYRTGAFQALALVALLGNLPGHIDPAQVRGALTQVFKNMYKENNCFDKNDWLVLGFCGHQPNIADYYTSTGSLYMATLSFLPLGLPADNPFWTNPPVDWTSKAAWSGKAFHKDYHVEY